MPSCKAVPFNAITQLASIMTRSNNPSVKPLLKIMGAILVYAAFSWVFAHALLDMPLIESDPQGEQNQ